jgi:hypothetical protein
MSQSCACLEWGGVMGTTVPIAMSTKFKCWFNKLLNFSNICKSFFCSLLVLATPMNLNIAPPEIVIKKF